MDPFEFPSNRVQLTIPTKTMAFYTFKPLFLHFIYAISNKSCNINSFVVIGQRNNNQAIKQSPAHVPVVHNNPFAGPTLGLKPLNTYKNTVSFI